MRFDHMLQDIDDLVSTDFCCDMEAKQFGEKYTQKEAQQMAYLLAKVYSIAHCVHCVSCGEKYRNVSTKK